MDLTGVEGRLQVVGDGRADVILLQNFPQSAGVAGDGYGGPAAARVAAQVACKLFQTAVVGSGWLEQFVLYIAQPAMQEQPGALLQGGGEVRPREEGRGEAAGQFAALLPRHPHVGEPLFQLQGFVLDLAGAFQHHNAVPVQVLQQAGVVEEAVVEDEAFDVGRGEEGYQFILDALLHLAIAPGEVHPLDELFHPAAVGDSRKLFPGRDDFHPLGGGHRPLALGVELPDCVDLVVPQLDAKGQVGVGREDVDDAAALAEGPGRLHHGFVAVAESHPLDQQVVQTYPLADFQRVAIGTVAQSPGHYMPRQGRTHGGADGRHHYRRRLSERSAVGGSKGSQGGQALVAGVGVHRQPLEGQHLRFGQQERWPIVAQVGQQVVVETPGVLRPGGYHQRRRLAQAPQGCDVGRGGPLAHRHLGGRLAGADSLRLAAEHRMVAKQRNEAF